MCPDPRLFTVSPVAARVYAAWQYLRDQGATPTHARIAATGNISESSVSRCMPELVAAGLLTRTWDGTANGGRGGYVLALPSSPDADPSPVDVSTHPQSIPSAQDGASIPPQPPSDAIGRNALMRERAIMESLSESHGKDSESLGGREDARAIGNVVTDESDAAWEAIGLYPRLIRPMRQIAAQRGWTLADFRADLAAARAARMRSPIGFVTTRWQSGQRCTDLTTPQEHPDARRTDPRTGRRPAADSAQRPAHARRTPPAIKPEILAECLAAPVRPPPSYGPLPDDILALVPEQHRAFVIAATGG